MTAFRDITAAFAALLSLVTFAAYAASLFYSASSSNTPLLASLALYELVVAALFAALPVQRLASRWRVDPRWEVALLCCGVVASLAQAFFFVLNFSPFFLVPLGAALAGVASVVAALVVRPGGAVRLLMALLATPAPIALTLAILVPAEVVGWPERYEVAAGYHGWVSIGLERPSCPALGRDGLEIVILADARGCGCTSGAPSLAYALTRYVAVRPDGTRTELKQSTWGGGGSIWGGYSGYASGAARPRRMGYFVGTEDEIQGAWRGPSSVEHERLCEADR